MTNLEAATGRRRLMATGLLKWIYLQVVGHTGCKVSEDPGVDTILSGVNVLLEALWGM